MEPTQTVRTAYIRRGASLTKVGIRITDPSGNVIQDTSLTFTNAEFESLTAHA